MKRVLLLLLYITVFCTPLLAEELVVLPLDDAASIGLTVEADPDTKTEGAGSIKITTLWPTTVCLGQVSGLDVENAQLVYTAKVKSSLQGAAFLEMWVQVAGGNFFSKGMNNPIEGESGWQTLSTPFMFQQGQRPGLVTLNLVINGTGTVWIDEILLSKKQL